MLPLRIETGRYRGEPIPDRICNLCDLNEVEDELHFLFKCDLYKFCRQDFLENIGISNLQYNDLNVLFKYLLTHFPRQSANFIYKAYNLRQRKITRM